jgi:hypothetical protein
MRTKKTRPVTYRPLFLRFIPLTTPPRLGPFDHFAVLIGALWFKDGHLRRGLVAGSVVMTRVFLLRQWQSG